MSWVCGSACECLFVVGGWRRRRRSRRDDEHYGVLLRIALRGTLRGPGTAYITHFQKKDLSAKHCHYFKQFIQQLASHLHESAAVVTPLYAFNFTKYSLVSLSDAAGDQHADAAALSRRVVWKGGRLFIFL